MNLFDDYNIIDSDAEDMKQGMMKKFEELSGRELTEASPETLIFSTVAYLIALREENYNDDIKQNYVRFARDKRLDLLGEHYGKRGDRIGEIKAKATFRFYIISPKLKEIVVPKGSLIKYGELYFETNEEYKIKIGDKFVDGVATCKTAGSVGNNIPVGAINTMVDLYPYFEKVENITISNGGTDIEEDEHYRERLRLVPDSFSVAGSRGAYIFWTKTVSPDIIDVSVASPNPCEVDIYVLTKNGEPTKELKTSINDVLNDEYIRPLTDRVSIKEPLKINYNVDFDYYIDKENEFSVNNIRNNIKAVVDDYAKWQKSRLGLDINPDELVKRLKDFGVKRLVIREPIFKKIDSTQFASVNDISINYLGVEEL